MSKKLKVFCLFALPLVTMAVLLHTNYTGKAGETNGGAADTVADAGRAKEACAGTEPLTPELIGKFEKLGFREFKLPPEQARMKLVNLAGEPVRLEDYAGTWVLLNFWSRRCPPCLREMPPLQNLWSEFRRKNFVVLGANLRADRSSIEETKQEFGLDFPLLRTNESQNGAEIAENYKVRILPTTFLISPDGVPRLKLLGPLRWDSPPIKRIFDQLCFGSDTAPDTGGADR